VELSQLFWHLNYLHFGGVLPPIELGFSNRLSTTGGTYQRTPFRRIQISSRYFEYADPWREITGTLGHEMIHYWLDYLGLPCGHTVLFRKKLQESGFPRYSRLKSKRLPYLFRCPGCAREFQRRKIQKLSCGPCSGKRFNPKYELQLISNA
jgi:predicted SprT family Zn-dependent metalloprotease